MSKTMQSRQPLPKPNLKPAQATAGERQPFVVNKTKKIK